MDQVLWNSLLLASTPALSTSSFSTALFQALFVGDRAGLKRQKDNVKRVVTRVASRPDSHLLFVSGLREEQGASGQQEIAAPAGPEEQEVRELYSSDEMDDPDTQEAIALSLAQVDDPDTQEAITLSLAEAGGRSHGSGGSGGIAGSRSGGLAGSGAMNEYVKRTKLKECRFFKKGKCARENRCKFAHNAREGAEGTGLEPDVLELIRRSQRKNIHWRANVKRLKGEVITVEDDSDSDDDVIWLPDATLIGSRRLGGRATGAVGAPGEARIVVKQEIIQEEIKEEPLEIASDIEENIVESENNDDEVGEMSDSSSDTSDMVSVKSEEDEDIFADVFENKEAIQGLSQIVERVKVPENKPSEVTSKPVIKPSDQFNIAKKPSDNIDDSKKSNGDDVMVDGILDSLAKYGRQRDVFADIVNASRRLKKPESQSNEDNLKLDDLKDKSKVEAAHSLTEFTHEVTESLKKSSSLTMKILSRGAEEELKKAKEQEQEASSRKQEGNINEELGPLGKEQELLVKEMEERELRRRQEKREDRLLRFTVSEGEKEKEERQMIEVGLAQKEKEELEQLGVVTESSRAIEKRVLESEKDVEKEKVYSSSAAGFVHSGRGEGGKRVQVEQEQELDDLLPPDLRAESGGEAGEGLLSEQELLSLQQRLAREQESLVAERGKAERVAASLTDQMYQVCILLCRVPSHRVEWGVFMEITVRVAITNPSYSCHQECQELLQLFGLPWLVAPTEAEAQCAFLDSAGLTQV